MSSAPLLATVADLALIVNETIADNDPTATLYLKVASGIVREETRQYLSAKTADLVYLTPTGYTAFLPELPIVNFTQLELKADGGTTWVVASPTSYDVDLDTGFIQGGYAWPTVRWPSRGRSWRATYDHGYAAGELPDGLYGAVLGLASRLWETPIGVENERVGERSIKYLMVEGGFLPHEQLAIDNFRLSKV